RRRGGGRRRKRGARGLEGRLCDQSRRQGRLAGFQFHSFREGAEAERGGGGFLPLSSESRLPGGRALRRLSETRAARGFHEIADEAPGGRSLRRCLQGSLWPEPRPGVAEVSRRGRQLRRRGLAAAVSRLAEIH